MKLFKNIFNITNPEVQEFQCQLIKHNNKIINNNQMKKNNTLL